MGPQMREIVTAREMKLSMKLRREQRFPHKLQDRKYESLVEIPLKAYKLKK
jgi:hypothetical protein